MDKWVGLGISWVGWIWGWHVDFGLGCGGCIAVAIRTGVRILFGEKYPPMYTHNISYVSLSNLLYSPLEHFPLLYHYPMFPIWMFYGCVGACFT